MPDTPASTGARRRNLRFLICFVTRRCNAKCGTCFYADSLNDGSPELTLADYTRIAEQAGPVNNLLFSGGEPSLRQDLDQIAEIFHHHCGVRHVAMPTNGLLPERVAQLAAGVLERCPDLLFDVNCSIDGPAEVHNRIRGVPGNFKKSEETLRRLIELRDQTGGIGRSRLRVHVETVICNSNYRDIPGLLDYFRDNYEVNGHFAEVIRGTPLNPALAPPPMDDLQAIHERILANHRHYAEHQRGPLAAEYVVIDRIYATQREFLRSGQWPMRCVAGESLAVLEPTGEVRLCELLKIVGNLRDHDWNLHALLDSHEAQKLRNWIVDSHCACTHCCFISESLQQAPPAEAEAPPSLGRRVQRAIKSVLAG